MSAAQQKVMDRAYQDIREARECATVEEWYSKYRAICYANSTAEEFKEQNGDMWDSFIAPRYNELRECVVLTSCNSRTLAKLEKVGLIEILHDSNGVRFGIDKVRVL